MQVLAESDAGDGDVGRSVHYCGLDSVVNIELYLI